MHLKVRHIFGSIIGTTLASVIVGSTQSEVTASSVQDRIIENVAAMAETSPLRLSLTCQGHESSRTKVAGSGTASAESQNREPASSEPRISLSYYKPDDERLHRIVADLSEQKITQVRSLIVLEAGETQFEVEKQVWKTLSPNQKSFHIDAEGRDQVFELKDQKALGVAEKRIETMAGLLQACCKNSGCRAALAEKSEH